MEPTDQAHPDTVNWAENPRGNSVLVDPTGAVIGNPAVNEVAP